MFNYDLRDDLGAEKAIVDFKNLKEGKERLIAICEAQIKAYQEKIQIYKDDIGEVEARLGQELKGYMATVSAKETKTQFSYQLPSAKLILKKDKQDFIKDDTKLLESIDKKYVKTKESVDWANYKKTLTISGETVVDENGEIVEGVTVAEVKGEFSIKI